VIFVNLGSVAGVEAGVTFDVVAPKWIIDPNSWHPAKPPCT
jgi:hypothetical protein